jgi:apolipoprotein N-acyltransferase
LAIKTQTHHIIGAVFRNGELDHNAAFLIGPQGNILGQYNKQHLVPFGEYVPFGKFFGKWIPYIGQLGTFDKGSDPVAFNVFDVKMAPNICYEAVFPGLIRNTLDKDVRCIINITNDAWYLNTGAPEQHFATNIFRAIENNRPVIRAANTGISAIINEDGEVVGRTKLMTEDVLFGEVYFEEFPWEFPEETLFSKWGDWFSWFCTFVFVLSFSFVLISQRRKTI